MSSKWTILREAVNTSQPIWVLGDLCGNRRQMLEALVIKYLGYYFMLEKKIPASQWVLDNIANEGVEAMVETATQFYIGNPPVFHRFVELIKEEIADELKMKQKLRLKIYRMTRERHQSF